jgi:peptidoglycan/xylan/chitin deacetylase (PgdA/CDA1 family)
MNAAKEIVRALLLSPAGALASRLLAPHDVTILMLHRFASEAGHGRGHTAAELRAILQDLRKRRVPVLSLAALCHAGSAPPSRAAIAFTVDDGYADFANVAWPIFREFDCPVTVFLMTGFIDGQLWPWWERVLWAFEHTRATRLRLRVGDQWVEHTFDDEIGRRRTATGLIERLKGVSDEAREAALTGLPLALGVVVPVQCPIAHAPMSWDDVRRVAREGATFGPHTVTHPVLSRVDDVRAEKEIVSSWARLRAETDAAIPVFCYPNGDRDSFGAREEALVARHGFTFAVSAIPGNAAREDFLPGATRRFRIPRHPCPHDPTMVRWVASRWTRVLAGERA